MRFITLEFTSRSKILSLKSTLKKIRKAGDNNHPSIPKFNLKKKLIPYNVLGITIEIINTIGSNTTITTPKKSLTFLNVNPPHQEVDPDTTVKGEYIILPWNINTEKGKEDLKKIISELSFRAGKLIYTICEDISVQWTVARRDAMAVRGDAIVTASATLAGKVKARAITDLGAANVVNAAASSPKPKAVTNAFNPANQEESTIVRTKDISPAASGNRSYLGVSIFDKNSLGTRSDSNNNQNNKDKNQNKDKKKKVTFAKELTVLREPSTTLISNSKSLISYNDYAGNYEDFSDPVITQGTMSFSELTITDSIFEDGIDTLLTRVAELETKTASLEKNCNDSKAEVLRLGSSLRTSEKLNIVLRNNIADLNNNINEKQTKVISLLNQADSLNIQISTLQNTNLSLNNHINLLNNDLTQKQSQISNLNKQVSNLTNKNLSLNNHIKNLNTQINYKNSEINSLNIKLISAKSSSGVKEQYYKKEKMSDYRKNDLNRY